MNRNQHVVPHERGWAVKGAGSERATSVHRTQAEAIEAGRAAAKTRHTELLVHGRDGRIRHRDGFGRDPYPPRG